MINAKSNNQNNEVQVFIIKQVEHYNKISFENKFKDFLGAAQQTQNIGQRINSVLKKIDNNVKRQTSYLVPLIYDNDEFQGATLSLLQNLTSKDYKDLNYINLKDRLVYNIDNIYINNNYKSILCCPLLDYSKLAYIFQTNIPGFLGISDVISFVSSLNVHQPSNCSISMNNFNFKYNFSYEDEAGENIYKSVFDTDDIVILRVAKRANRDYTKLKYKDIYAGDEKDYFQTVFTGYINNVNESINWQSRSQTLNINCSGASKKISYKRLITGQATVDKDVSSALVPISCYSIPQALDKDNKPTLKNKDVVKNVIVRTLTSIDNIEECLKAKDNFEFYFLKNAEQKEAQTEDINKVNEYRTNYNSYIQKNFDLYSIDSEGTTNIYSNVFKVNHKENYLPIFTINGTEQPAYQYAFNQFNNLFVATYDTVYQFIKKIADNLEFVFYDDQYGIIHFELINTDLVHLYDKNDPNNFTQVTSFNTNQNTENIVNILTITTNSEFSGILDGQSFGLLAVVRDAESIKKYGERPMPPKPITGLIKKEACERYGRSLMYKMNRKINSYSLSLIGDPSIKLGKYGYFRDFHKLFYVETLKHQYTAGSSLVTTLTGSYEKEIIGRATDLINNPFETSGIAEFKPKTSDKNNKQDKDALFVAFKNAFDNKLETINPNSYIEDMNKIWKNQDLSQIQKNILNKVQNKYSYQNNNESEYIANTLYNPNFIPFLYLDGYFWTQNFENDLFFQAMNVQKQIIEEQQKTTQKTIQNKTKITTTDKINRVKTKNKAKPKEQIKVMSETQHNLHAVGTTIKSWFTQPKKTFKEVVDYYKKKMEMKK